MKETILVPRKRLYPLFKRTAFDKGMHVKLNAVSNREKHTPQAMQQGDVHKQNTQAMQQGRCQQCNRGTREHTKIKQRTQRFAQRMKHNGFVCGRLCWRLQEFWFVGGPVGRMAISCVL
jgi:hypothetical protein